MSMFTLAISCWTTSNLAWFHGPKTFQVPIQYCFIASEFTSITSHIHNWVLFLLWLCLFILSGIISSLFSVAYWTSTDLGSLSFSVLSFCLFILFTGFSRQEYGSGLPFPFPVDHIFSELSTMSRPFWLALHVMAHSFIELNKGVVQDITCWHMSVFSKL